MGIVRGGNGGKSLTKYSFLTILMSICYEI
jgi:hypothetical protein